MSIVSSVITQANVQIDGRTSVRELWVDDQGNEFIYDYMADVGTDLNAIMLSRTINVDAQSEAQQAGG